MKTVILNFLAFFAFVGSLAAQSPEGMNYQAVIRNSSGVPVASQTVGVRFRIYQTSASGTLVYAETHSVSTTAQGMVNMIIGKGTVVSGVFADIDWAAGPYSLDVAADPTGGTSYVSLSNTQLLSVPYALHAKSAAHANDDGDRDSLNEKQDLVQSGDMIYLNKLNTPTMVDLSKYKLSEAKIDSFADNNGYAKTLSGITEYVFNGSFTNGVGNGDSAYIITMPSHTTWHFDVVVTAHDINSNTNMRSVHREFLVYRQWTLDAAIQNLVTHYDYTTGNSIDVIFGTNANQEVYYKLSQTSGFSTDTYYRVHVTITKAN